MRDITGALAVGFLAGCAFGMWLEEKAVLPPLPKWVASDAAYMLIARPADAPIVVCDPRSEVVQNITTHQIERISVLNGQAYLCMDAAGK